MFHYTDIQWVLPAPSSLLTPPLICVLFLFWGLFYILLISLLPLMNTPRLLCAPLTNHSCTPIFCFPLLFFLNNFILLIIYLFIILLLFKKYIFQNYKNYNYRKNQKNILFHLYCVCPVAGVVWHFLPNNSKILKIFFFSFSVCATARGIWHIFSSNSEIPKNIKFQNIKTSTFLNNDIFEELHDHWFSIVRYVGVRPILVRFTSKKNQIIFK